MRRIEEWVGKTDDTPVPPRVKVRVFEKYDGCCYLTGQRIRPGDKWEVEHILALCNGGQNRESNLAPALRTPHKSKTRLDRQIKKKLDKIRKRHLGVKKRRRTIAYRKFDGTPVPSRWR